MHNRKLYNLIINSISKVVKKLINEAFDFNSVKKQNKSINGVDIVLQHIIWKIDCREVISKDDYDILKNCVGIYKVSGREELKELIKYFTELFGNECNLNWIDVSNVTDMSHLFSGEVIDIGELSKMNNFNGDISKWDVTNVINMASMFECSEFTGNISKWNVSNVTNMNSMFYYSLFNGNISKWNVSNVIDMRYMFMDSNFNKDISKWNINNKCNTDNIFSDCSIKDEYKPKKTKIK